MSAIRTFASALGAGLTIERATTLSGDFGPHLAIVEDIIEFANHTGVPRVGALEALADSIDEAERREREIDVGTASARQTARLLAAMPVATAAGAQLFGLDVLTVLVTTALGWVCVTLGIALSGVAWWWMGRIRRGIFSPAVHSGLAINLAAGIASSSSLSEERRRLLRQHAVAWGTVEECAVIDQYRELALDAGVPVAGLLTNHATLLRQRLHARVKHDITLLPGRLLVPVGVCLLPAFVVTTVIPVVVTMVTNSTR